VNDLVQTGLVAVLSALLGGGVWSFAATWLGKKLDKEEREVDRLRADHQKCEERVEALERRLESVEHHHASLVPRWIKDANKRILWINGAAMLTIFGPLRKTRDQVEGHTFQDLLDMEAAREVDRLDRAALAHPGRAVSSLLQLHHQLGPMHIVKIAGVGRDSELIYEGYAYSANDPADANDRGDRRQEEQLGLSLLRLQGPIGSQEPLAPQAE
jgi:hypothetical protein